MSYRALQAIALALAMMASTEAWTRPIGYYVGTRKKGGTECTQQFSVDMHLGGAGRMDLYTSFELSPKDKSSVNASALIHSARLTFDEYLAAFEGTMDFVARIPSYTGVDTILTAETRDGVRRVTLDRSLDALEMGSKGRVTFHVRDGRIVRIDKKYKRALLLGLGYLPVLSDSCVGMTQQNVGLASASDDCPKVIYTDDAEIRHALKRRGMFLAEGTDADCWK